MKKTEHIKKQLIIILLLFNIINTVSSQDWIIQESNTSSYLQDLFFITYDKGFVVGTNGTLLQTTNGGLDWSIIPLNTTSHLRSIYFTDTLCGFITSDYELFKTEDGGQAWISQDSIYRGNIRFFDQDTGFVFGPQEVLATVDGGLTWISQIPSYSAVHYDGAMAVDSKTFFMWGAYGTVYKSTDGGTSWQLVYGASTQSLYDIYFVNDSTGYLVGGENGHGSTSAILNKTTNRGEDWGSCFPLNSGTSFKHLHSICFVNEQLGFVVGEEGNIGKTTDSGNTWTKLESPTNHALTKVFFLDSLIGYSVGTNGTILKTINGGYNNISSSVTKTQINIYPNPFTSYITIQSENFDNLNTQIYVYNLDGRAIYNTSSLRNSIVLDLEKLKSGIYIVKIYNDKYSSISIVSKL